MSRQSEIHVSLQCMRLGCAQSDQNPCQNQQRQRVSFQDVRRRAKGAVRHEKKSGDDTHAGMDARVCSDSPKHSSARIRTRLGERKGYGSSPINPDIAVPNQVLFCSLLQRNTTS